MALEDLSDPDPIFVNLANSLEIQPTSMVQVKVYIKDQALKKLTKFDLAGVSVESVCGEQSVMNDDEYELYICPHEEILQHGFIMSLGIISLNAAGEAFVKIANPTDDFMYLESGTCVITCCALRKRHSQFGPDRLGESASKRYHDHGTVQESHRHVKRQPGCICNIRGTSRSSVVRQCRASCVS